MYIFTRMQNSQEPIRSFNPQHIVMYNKYLWNECILCMVACCRSIMLKTRNY